MQHSSDYAHIPVNNTAYEHDGLLAWDLPGHMLINSTNPNSQFYKSVHDVLSYFFLCIDQVYCPRAHALVHVRPLPPGGIGARDVDIMSAVPQGEDAQSLTFLGPMIEDSVAQSIAQGIYFESRAVLACRAQSPVMAHPCLSFLLASYRPPGPKLKATLRPPGNLPRMPLQEPPQGCGTGAWQSAWGFLQPAARAASQRGW